MKYHLPEGVQFVEGAGAEAAERVRLIQYPRNPLLLLQRREGNFELFDYTLADVWLCPANATPNEFFSSRLQHMEHILSIGAFGVWYNMTNGLVRRGFNSELADAADRCSIHGDKQRARWDKLQ